MSREACLKMIQEASFGYGHHRIILDESGDPCDFEILDANPAFGELIGKKDEDLVNKKITDLFPELRHPVSEWVSSFGKIAMDGGNREFEQSIPSIGRSYKVQVYSSSKYYFSTIFNDITAQKQVYEDLKKSEEKFRSLVENLNEIVYVLNEKAEIEYVSPNMKVLGGYTKSEVMNRLFMDFVHPEDKAQRFSEFKRVLSGEFKATEYRFLKKNGESFWVRTSARPVMRDGKPVGVQGVLTDINDRKQTEFALIESERRFRQIFENTPFISVQGYDRDRNVIYWNNAAEQLYGYSREEALGRKLENLIIPESMRKGVIDVINRCIDGDVQIPSSELKLQRADGSLVPVFSSHIKLHNPKGEPELYCIDIDLTEQKKAESLIYKNLKEKEMLLSEIHHRVKNNMAVISSLMTLQSEFVEKEKNPESLLQETKNRINSMAMVHELVYENTNFLEIDFGSLLYRLVDELSSIYQQESKIIKVDIHAQNVMLDINKSVPLSLFANEVISNAFKHAFVGRDKGTICVRFERNQKGYRFVISDNGVGVSKPNLLEEPKSFGYTIIHGLIGQLRGKLDIQSNGDGLRIEAVFNGVNRN